MQTPEPLNYISWVPKALPDGEMLVHNRVKPMSASTRPGTNGFRVWTTSVIKDNYAICDCGWSGLPHYMSAPKP
jgi:hypothetical protein